MSGVVWRTTVIAIGTTLVSSCLSGPTYHAEPAVNPRLQIHSAVAADSSRAFFDSLAIARSGDSSTLATNARQAPLIEQRLRDDAATSLSWTELLRDSTLMQLVQTAVKQNRTVQAAAARIREYRAAASNARTFLYPNVTVNGSESANQTVFGSSPPVSFRAARVTSDMAWELDFWGKVRRGIDAANADRESQDAAERAVVLSLVSDVATAYLQLLEFDEERDIALRTLRARQSTLDLARQRFAQGVISELDVRQFEAQVAAPAVTLSQVARRTALTEHALSVLLGETPSAIARHGSLASAVNALLVPDTLSAALLSRRPDVQQAERAFAAATARIGATMASNLPSIALTGSLGSQASGPSKLFASGTKIYTLSAGISFPLTALTRGADATAGARARADQAKAAYENTALNALREASDALVGVRSSRDQLTAQLTQANALRRALELAELRYDSGISNYLEVLDAQRNLFSAELGLSQARLDQLTSAVLLYKALGGSWNR